MRQPWHTLLLALAGCFLLCVTMVAQGTVDLSTLETKFTHTSKTPGSLSVVVDNWRIAFITHNKTNVGAVLISELEPGISHAANLDDTASRLAGMAGFSTPIMQVMEHSDRATAIMVDRALIENIAGETNHVFQGSPLEGMAYLLLDNYFYIDNITNEGWLLWKTIKKSQVELLMPLAPGMLEAVEMTGSQKMNNHAAEVLARLLGLGTSTAPKSTRRAVCSHLELSDITYMNTNSNMIGAYHNKRFAIGKRQPVADMLSDNFNGNIQYPAEVSDWPVDPSKEQEAPAPKEVKILTPEEAREAYKELLRSLAS